MSPVRENIDFLSDGAVGRETSTATPSDFRDIAEEGTETRKPFVYWASCAIREDEKTAHHLRGVSDLVFIDGGGEGSRTPVRNGFARASTRVSGLWSRMEYADQRAYPHPSVRFDTLRRASGAPRSVACYIMPRRSADIGASTSRPLFRRRDGNRCSQLLFVLVF